MNTELAKAIINAAQLICGSYLPNLMILPLAIGIVVIVMVVLLGAYLRQKGKEYAKREHIAQLTQVVESIKLDNQKEFEALAQENRLALSAFEQSTTYALPRLTSDWRSIRKPILSGSDSWALFTKKQSCGTLFKSAMIFGSTIRSIYRRHPVNLLMRLSMQPQCIKP
ncbi:hypothetical protein KBB45_11095 [Myxococcota bacterium]|nr:hypothetical protein [Myxococcota bacterium]